VLEGIEMSNDQISRRLMHMSDTEHHVIVTLTQLFPTYSVVPEHRLIKFEDQFKNVFTYQPDFEIQTGDGRLLMIEVKSEHSLSLPNMIRFVEINKAIRKNPANGFMILVVGTQHSSSKFVERPEFKELRIFHTKDLSNVRQVIENEIAALHLPA
jgi:hypothetical protein